MIVLMGKIIAAVIKVSLMQVHQAQVVLLDTLAILLLVLHKKQTRVAQPA